MCGLFGIFATGADKSQGLPLAPDRIAEAFRLSEHRGPNLSQLTFFNGNQDQTLPLNGPLGEVGLYHGVFGHHRLSIIDRSTAASQPMQWRKQGVWIVYNGEIYNYHELRGELQTRGYTFESRSDTEVLLALYEAEGPDMVHRLNGMFAFAIWDGRTETLIMARDRYGIKPFYYTRLECGAFAFASESKNLLALPGCKRDLNPQALSEHFSFQNTFGEKTLLQAVSILEAGHWARLTHAPVN